MVVWGGGAGRFVLFIHVLCLNVWCVGQVKEVATGIGREEDFL